MKEIIQIIFVVIGLTVATILGIYGQDFSYSINETYPEYSLTTSITIITILSIGLFIMIPILLFIFKKWINKLLFKLFLIACGLIGVPISMWTFFVWSMWMH